jgi:GDP-L-fucose synthase
MNKEGKIYIAGHQGMVGSALLRNLRAAGYERFVLRGRDELDLSRQEDTEAFFESEKPDFVIVAAAKVGGIIANNTYRAQFIYENLMIQNNIIHSAYRSGVKKLLFLGSSCIYPRLAPQPLKESCLLTGELEFTNEPYAIAKIAGIKMCESYYRQYGCDFISVMPTNLYGPNDNFNLETSHVLPALIRRFYLAHCLEEDRWDAIAADFERNPLKGTGAGASRETLTETLRQQGIRKDHEHGPVSVTLWGTGTPLREFMHADDMAAACIHIMENVSSRQLYEEIGSTHINIGVGHDISIAGLAGLVRKATGFSGEFRFDPSKPDGTPRKLMDVSLLQSLGFTARIGLEDGIREVVARYAGN